jgi:hypothetical protein
MMMARGRPQLIPQQHMQQQVQQQHHLQQQHMMQHAHATSQQPFMGPFPFPRGFPLQTFQQFPAAHRPMHPMAGMPPAVAPGPFPSAGTHQGALHCGPGAPASTTAPVPTPISKLGTFVQPSAGFRGVGDSVGTTSGGGGGGAQPRGRGRGRGRGDGRPPGRADHGGGRGGYGAGFSGRGRDDGPSGASASASVGAGAGNAGVSTGQSSVRIPDDLLQLIPPRFRYASTIGNSAEEVEKWKADRRKHFPTDENIKKKVWCTCPAVVDVMAAPSPTANISCLSTGNCGCSGTRAWRGGYGGSGSP